MRIGEYERLTERVLRSYGPAQSLRTSHNCGWLAVENRLTRRPRCPVDGVLEYAGYTVIVFRRRDQHRIRFANRGLKRLHGLRIALIVNIGVVRRNISKTSTHLNFHARRR